MEKIVVLTNGLDQDNKLIECLKIIFPECEIDIQQRIDGGHEPADIIFEHNDMALGEDIEKYLSFL